MAVSTVAGTFAGEDLVDVLVDAGRAGCGLFCSGDQQVVLTTTSRSQPVERCTEFGVAVEPLLEFLDEIWFGCRRPT